MLDQIKAIFSEAKGKDMTYDEVSKKLRQLDDKEFKSYTTKNSIERIFELPSQGRRPMLRTYYKSIELALAVFLRRYDVKTLDQGLRRDALETWNSGDLDGPFDISGWYEDKQIWYFITVDAPEEDRAQGGGGASLLELASDFEEEWTDNYVSPEWEAEMEAAGE